MARRSADALWSLLSSHHHRDDDCDPRHGGCHGPHDGQCDGYDDDYGCDYGSADDVHAGYYGPTPSFRGMMMKTLGGGSIGNDGGIGGGLPLAVGEERRQRHVVHTLDPVNALADGGGADNDDVVQQRRRGG